ncbi:MAG TPA: acyl-CoA thioesterase [Flavobacteriaceae bacterium]|nr:acyl-CoA thioesterase [Flavobacteriaceae bacterium]
MKPIPFQYEISVPRSAIDHFEHVNNVFYLNWVQEVAEKHWKAKTPKAVREKLGWVVLDHFIKYKHPGFENEELILKTWIESYGNVKSVRRTEIIRKHDQVLIAEAKTTWCLMDLKTFKPTRISPEITAPYFEP